METQHHPYYNRLERALSYIAENWRKQPDLNEIAAAAALSPAHFQRIFSEWVGVSPKQLCALLTHEHAALALRSGQPLLEVALDSGLSGASRLHDLFLKLETMTPGQYQQLGKGIEIRYAFHETPFGRGLFAISDRGLAGLSFPFSIDNNRFSGDDEAIMGLQKRWPKSRLIADPNAGINIRDQLFYACPNDRQAPLSILLKGTEFQLKVWQGLIALPAGQIISYKTLGNHIGKSSNIATRAIGGAVGANPISWLIPCHRVLAQSGLLNGYHWGLSRKVAMLGHEFAGNSLNTRLTAS